MKIISVTPEIMEYFKDMIPEEVLRGNIWVLATVEDSEIFSVAVVDCNQEKQHLSLKWIMTDDVQQKQGGAALIMTHLQSICDKHSFVLTASYDDIEPNSHVISHMFMKIGGEVRVATLPEYTFTREEILKFPVAKKGKEPSKKIVPLSNVKDNILNIFLNSTDEVDVNSILDADKDFSFAYMDNEVIGALLLLEKLDDETLGISTFYVNSEYNAVAPSFVGGVINTVLNEHDEIEKVLFEALDERVEEIIKLFAGEKEPTGNRDLIIATYDAR